MKHQHLTKIDGISLASTNNELNLCRVSDREYKTTKRRASDLITAVTATNNTGYWKR